MQIVQSAPTVRATNGVWAYAAGAIAAICALNLNGISWQVLSLPQLFSPVILVCSLLLLMRGDARSLLDPRIVTLCIGVAAYVGFGLVFTRTGDYAIARDLAASYFSSIVIIVAVCAHVVSTSDAAFRSFVRLVGFLFFLTCVGTLLSNYISPFYLHLPPSADSRAIGFFSNPNEAGMAAVAAMLFVLWHPPKNSVLFGIQLCVCIVAAVSTFSKAAFIALLVVLAAHLIARRRYAWAALAVLVYISLPTLLGELSISSAFELDADQRRRIAQVAELLGGQLNASTTTGRTTLLDIALARIHVIFPLGDGLGSFHFIVGGLFEGDVWQGAHNAYLMTLGEAGIVPFVALVTWSLMTGYGALTGRSTFAWQYFCVWQVEMFSSHHALELRFHDLMIGLTLGVLAR